MAGAWWDHKSRGGIDQGSKAFNLDVQRSVDAEQHLRVIMGVLANFAVVATYRFGVYKGWRHCRRISTNRRRFQGCGNAINQLMADNEQYKLSEQGIDTSALCKGWFWLEAASDRKNACRSLGVLSRMRTAQTLRQRGTAVFENREEGPVLPQRH